MFKSWIVSISWICVFGWIVNNPKWLPLASVVQPLVGMRCNFCGKSKKEVQKLIAGPKCYICNECVETAQEIVQEQAKSNGSTKRSSKSTHTPFSIKEYLDKYVIGQDAAKEVLAVAAYSHHKRVNNPSLNLKKSNVLLAGPTGSGKTYMISKLAEILDVPWVTVDTSGLTAAGYKGADIEEAFEQLVSKANGDKNRAQHGIVYLDEVDKIRASASTSSKELDVGGRSMQQRLLKILEGCEVDINANKTGSRSAELIDTSNILFIASGAFVGLKNYAQPHSSDFIEFGMIPEFVGRFQMKTSLKHLDLQDMIRILSEAKDNIVDSYKNWFKSEKVILNFTPQSLKQIASKALSSDTGARGLQGIVDDLLMPALFEIPSMKRKPKVVWINNADKNVKPEFVYESKNENKAA